MIAKEIDEIREALKDAISATRYYEGYYADVIDGEVKTYDDALLAIDRLEAMLKPSGDAKALFQYIRPYRRIDLLESQQKPQPSAEECIDAITAYVNAKLQEAANKIRGTVEGGSKCPDGGPMFHVYMDGVVDAVEAACATILGAKPK